MTQNEFSVPILTYHSIDSTGSVISTSPEKFRQQMDHLAKSSFQVESLSALALCLRETRPLPKNRVVLTFDDGFKSVYDMAFPVLKEYGFGATVFLVTDYCGKTNGWPGQSARVPPLELMTWDQISSMAPHNIDFGVHTATHPDLSKVSTQKIADEIIGAQVILQQRLGTRQQAFAYPYGRSCSAAADIVKSGFYAACSTRMDVVTTTSDIHFLPRLDMYYFSRNQKFTTLGTPQFERYIRFRSSMRRVREALLRD